MRAPFACVAIVMVVAQPFGSRPASAQVPPTQVVATVGHGSDISQLAYSSDGRLVASVSSDKKAILWDIASRRELRTFIGHDKALYNVAFSPDGRLLATSDQDGVIKLWETDTGRERRSLQGLEHFSNVLAFSPDGAWLLTGNSQLILWEVATGRQIRIIEAGKIVTSAAFSPDGGTVVGIGDHGLDLWNPRTGARVSGLALQEGRAASISRDGKTVAYATAKLIGLFDIARGATVRTLPQGAHKVGFGKDGRLISVDEQVRRWNVSTGEAVATYRSPVTDARRVVLSPDGAVMGARGERAPRLFNGETGAALPAQVALGIPNWFSLFSPDQTAVMSIRRDATVIRTVADGRQIRVLNGVAGTFAAPSWHGGKSVVVAAGPDGIQISDLETGQELRKHAVGAMATASLSPDGRFLAAGGRDGSLRLIDAATGREVRELRKGVPRSLLSFLVNMHMVSVSPDGRSLLTLELGGGTALWDLATGGTRDLLREPAAFSSSGRSIYVGTGAGELEERSVDDARVLRRFERPSQPVAHLDRSPDGRLLIGLSANATATVWAAETGKRIATFNALGVPFGPLDISISDDRIVTVNQDNVIRRWSLSGGLLASTTVADDGEWVTITPEGFFDASPNGARMLTVVRGLDVFSVDQAYQVLYRPDLVREKLSGDLRGLVRASAARLDLDKVMASGPAPGVRVAAGTGFTGEAATVRADRIEATATVTDAGGGVGKVEWRVNGVTLGVETPRGFDRLGATPAAQPRPQAAAPLTLKRSLALDPGENVIEVVAYNAANLIASNPARVVVAREVAPQAAKPRLHVLAVGVNDYRDSRLKLSFATVDAKALGEGLKRAGGGLYASVEVTTVLDDGATAQNLDKVFAALAPKVRPDDVFVFFLAGHGKTVDGRYYFLPHDFRYAGDETIVSHGIGQDKWQTWFARIPARKSLLLYDTCESGSLTGDRVAVRGIERVAALERMTRATGRTTLTASTDDAPALEGYRGHGVFTYALLDALGKADGNNDGIVDVTEIASFIDTKVPELSFEAFRQRQFPQMKIVGSNFPVAGKTALLPAGGDAAAPIATRPTHVVITAADVFAQTGGRRPSTTRLPVGTLVTLVRIEQGWALVAKDGKPLGYVPQQQLVAAQ